MVTWMNEWLDGQRNNWIFLQKKRTLMVHLTVLPPHSESCTVVVEQLLALYKSHVKPCSARSFL